MSFLVQTSPYASSDRADSMQKLPEELLLMSPALRSHGNERVHPAATVHSPPEPPSTGIPLGDQPDTRVGLNADLVEQQGSHLVLELDSRDVELQGSHDNLAPSSSQPGESGRPLMQEGRTRSDGERDAVGQQHPGVDASISVQTELNQSCTESLSSSYDGGNTTGPGPSAKGDGIDTGVTGDDSMVIQGDAREDDGGRSVGSAHSTAPVSQATGSSVASNDVLSTRGRLRGRGRGRGRSRGKGRGGRGGRGRILAASSDSAPADPLLQHPSAQSGDDGFDGSGTVPLEMVPVYEGDEVVIGDVSEQCAEEQHQQAPPPLGMGGDLVDVPELRDGLALRPLQTKWAKGRVRSQKPLCRVKGHQLQQEEPEQVFDGIQPRRRQEKKPRYWRELSQLYTGHGKGFSSHLSHPPKTPPSYTSTPLVTASNRDRKMVHLDGDVGSSTEDDSIINNGRHHPPPSKGGEGVDVETAASSKAVGTVGSGKAAIGTREARDYCLSRNAPLSPGPSGMSFTAGSEMDKTGVTSQPSPKKGRRQTKFSMSTRRRERGVVPPGEAPLQKKRGRPRKHPLPDTPNTEATGRRSVSVQSVEAEGICSSSEDPSAVTVESEVVQSASHMSRQQESDGMVVKGNAPRVCGQDGISGIQGSAEGDKVDRAGALGVDREKHNEGPSPLLEPANDLLVSCGVRHGEPTCTQQVVVVPPVMEQPAPEVVQVTGGTSAPVAPEVVQVTGAISAPVAPEVVQVTGAISAPVAPEVVQVTSAPATEMLTSLVKRKAVDALDLDPPVKRKRGRPPKKRPVITMEARGAGDGFGVGQMFAEKGGEGNVSKQATCDSATVAGNSMVMDGKVMNRDSHSQDGRMAPKDVPPAKRMDEAASLKPATDPLSSCRTLHDATALGNTMVSTAPDPLGTMVSTAPDPLGGTMVSTAPDPLGNTMVSTAPDPLVNTMVCTAPDPLGNTMVSTAPDPLGNTMVCTAPDPLVNTMVCTAPDPLGNTMVSTAPDPLGNTMVCTVPDPRGNTMVCTAPDPLGTMVSTAPDPLVNTMVSTTPDPLGGTMVSTAPDPLGNTMVCTASDPRGNTMVSTAPDPLGNTMVCTASDPRGNTMVSTAPDPLGNTMVSTAPDPRGNTMVSTAPNVSFTSAHVNSSLITASSLIQSTAPEHDILTTPIYPSTAEVPSTHPSTTEVPSTHPSTTEVPSTHPSTAEVPSTHPSTPEVPSMHPSTTEVPSTHPSTTEVPSTHPSTTEVPSMHPSTTEVPSVPLSVASIHPSTTEVPSTHPSTTEVPSVPLSVASIHPSVTEVYPHPLLYSHPLTYSLPSMISLSSSYSHMWPYPHPLMAGAYPHLPTTATHTHPPSATSSLTLPSAEREEPSHAPFSATFVNPPATSPLHSKSNGGPLLCPSTAGVQPEVPGSGHSDMVGISSGPPAVMPTLSHNSAETAVAMVAAPPPMVGVSRYPATTARTSCHTGTESTILALQELIYPSQTGMPSIPVSSCASSQLPSCTAGQSGPQTKRKMGRPRKAPMVTSSMSDVPSLATTSVAVTIEKLTGAIPIPKQVFPSNREKGLVVTIPKYNLGHCSPLLAYKGLTIPGGDGENSLATMRVSPPGDNLLPPPSSQGPPLPSASGSDDASSQLPVFHNDVSAQISLPDNLSNVMRCWTQLGCNNESVGASEGRVQVVGTHEPAEVETGRTHSSSVGQVLGPVGVPEPLSRSQEPALSPESAGRQELRQVVGSCEPEVGSCEPEAGSCEVVGSEAGALHTLHILDVRGRTTANDLSSSADSPRGAPVRLQPVAMAQPLPVETPVVKRGRGRPRKHPLLPLDGTTVNQQQVNGGRKRKRSKVKESPNENGGEVQLPSTESVPGHLGETVTFQTSVVALPETLSGAAVGAPCGGQDDEHPCDLEQAEGSPEVPLQNELRAVHAPLVPAADPVDCEMVQHPQR